MLNDIFSDWIGVIGEETIMALFALIVAFWFIKKLLDRFKIK